MLTKEEFAAALEEAVRCCHLMLNEGVTNTEIVFAYGLTGLLRSIARADSKATLAEIGYAFREYAREQGYDERTVHFN